MNGELRCEYKLHGVVVEQATGVLEVKCSSSYCGAKPGVVVLHYFNLSTCSLQETKRFQDPNKFLTNNNKEKRGAPHLHTAAVRPA